jgi:hypothetical protein
MMNRVLFPTKTEIFLFPTGTYRAFTYIPHGVKWPERKLTTQFYPVSAGGIFFLLFSPQSLASLYGVAKKLFQFILYHLWIERDRLCGLVVRVPGYSSRGPGSIPGTTRFSEK